MDKIDWVVFVTRHYHCLVQPFIVLWKKYFDVPLTFFSDRDIPNLDPHYRVLKVFPKDCALYQESCGNYIKAGLSQLSNPIMSILLIDQLLQRTVDQSQIAVLRDFMLGNSVARGDICTEFEDGVHNAGVDDPSSVLYNVDGHEIIRISPFNPHIGLIGCTHLMPALWRRDFLLGFVEDQWRMDQIEIPGSYKFADATKAGTNKWYSVGMWPGQLKIAHLIYSRDTTAVELSRIKPEDRDLVRAHVTSDLRIID